MIRVIGFPAVWGAMLIAVLAAPPARAALESAMALHMLVQIPLLAAAGALLAAGLPRRVRDALQASNDFGLPGITLALAVSSLWMIPRALDWALASPLAEVIKFVSVPLAVGVPLALSWDRLHPIAKGFVAANWIPTLPVLGWLYRESPARLCNYYLVEEQVVAGEALMALGAVLAAVWLASLFWGGTLWTTAARSSGAPRTT